MKGSNINECRFLSLEFFVTPYQEHVLLLYFFVGWRRSPVSTGHQPFCIMCYAITGMQQSFHFAVFCYSSCLMRWKQTDPLGIKVSMIITPRVCAYIKHQKHTNTFARLCQKMFFIFACTYCIDEKWLYTLLIWDDRCADGDHWIYFSLFVFRQPSISLCWQTQGENNQCQEEENYFSE